MAQDSCSRNRFLAGNGRMPLVLAHRGASTRETENTLAAFRCAMAQGADGVELDVVRCASGEAVVCHDDDLVRLAGRPERIAALPLAALRQIRLRGGGEIPTLDEALALLAPAGLVNIEIKYAGIGPGGCRALVAAVAESVARAEAAHRVCVSSFSPAAVWLWQKREPHVPCGLLWERPRRFHRPWPLPVDWLLPLLRPFAVHPEASLCTPAAVAGWRRRGYAVNVWTVDEPARIEALAGLGVSAIITNEPQRARAALAGLALTLQAGGG
jgi:glycerophosphoryl diester phosphodiesterase